MFADKIKTSVRYRRKHGSCRDNESQQIKGFSRKPKWVQTMGSRGYYVLTNMNKIRLLWNCMTDEKKRWIENCCNATSCILCFVGFPLADEPAGSSKPRLFPFGWFLHVIPFGGMCICQRYTRWEWYRWLQIYCLSVWPSAAWISRSSHNAGPDTELLNHALARTRFTPISAVPSHTLLHY